MADYTGEKTMDIRVTGPSFMVGEQKLLSILKPAGLVPDRMRCDMRMITQGGEIEFHFVGRVKIITAAKEAE